MILVVLVVLLVPTLARVGGTIFSHVIFSAIVNIVFLISCKPAYNNKSDYVAIEFDRNLHGRVLRDVSRNL